jgi:hypothetical protein
MASAKNDTKDISAQCKNEKAQKAQSVAAEASASKKE